MKRYYLHYLQTLSPGERREMGRKAAAARGHDGSVGDTIVRYVEAHGPVSRAEVQSVLGRNAATRLTRLVSQGRIDRISRALYDRKETP